MTFLLSLISTTLLLTGVLYFGWRKPAYSHLRHTISELGEEQSPVAHKVNIGLFLPVGLLLFGVAWQTDMSAMHGLATCLGLGYVVAAFFPCDVRSPVSGSGRQQLHNLGGAVEYIGGAYFLTQISTELTVLGANPFKLGAGLVIAGAILLSLPIVLSVRGLVQRLIETVLFGSLIAVAY